MLSGLKSDAKPYPDLSVELADELDWKAGTLRNFEHHLDTTAWTYEPVSGLLAIGAYTSALPRSVSL
jgi:syntaxin-binding protein 5